MRDIEQGQIEAVVRSFLRPDSTAHPSRRRERSWDLCYDHFQNHPNPADDMELSCLHLGYYLASWGMLRGSTFLFKNTNALHYRDVINVVQKHNDAMRGWDVPDYLEEGRYEQYEAAWADLKQALLPDGGIALTLISKVMMGVWGCIPSFDTYFLETFRNRLSTTRAEKRAWRKGNFDALRMLSEVWLAHENEIERVRASYQVFSFATGQPSSRHLTRAKVLDIYGFQSAASSSQSTVAPAP